jgi:hypothetical protein
MPKKPSDIATQPPDWRRNPEAEAAPDLDTPAVQVPAPSMREQLAALWKADETSADAKQALFQIHEHLCGARASILNTAGKLSGEAADVINRMLETIG